VRPFIGISVPSWTLFYATRRTSPCGYGSRDPDMLRFIRYSHSWRGRIISEIKGKQYALKWRICSQWPVIEHSGWNCSCAISTAIGLQWKWKGRNVK
jgi:hypothetical protein